MRHRLTRLIPPVGRRIGSLTVSTERRQNSVHLHNGIRVLHQFSAGSIPSDSSLSAAGDAGAVRSKGGLDGEAPI